MGLARMVYTLALGATGIALAQQAHSNELFGPTSRYNEMYYALARAGVLHTLANQNEVVAKAATETGMFSKLEALKSEGIEFSPNMDGGFPGISFGERIGWMNLAGNCLEIGQSRTRSNHQIEIEYALCSDYTWGSHPLDHVKTAGGGMSVVRSLKYLLQDSSFDTIRADAISLTQQAYAASEKVVAALDDAEAKYKVMMEELKAKITPLYGSITQASIINESLNFSNPKWGFTPQQSMYIHYEFDNGHKIALTTSNPTTVNGCIPVTSAVVQRQAISEGNLFTFQYAVVDKSANLMGVIIEGNVPNGKVSLIPGDSGQNFFSIPEEVVKNANETFGTHVGSLMEAANKACAVIDSAGKSFLDEAIKARPQTPEPRVVVKGKDT